MKWGNFYDKKAKYEEHCTIVEDKKFQTKIEKVMNRRKNVSSAAYNSSFEEYGYYCVTAPVSIPLERELTWGFRLKVKRNIN